jgi:triosephosphate isomerase
MNGTAAEAVNLASGVRRGLPREVAAEVVVCPPFTSLAAVAEILAGCEVRLGAQNVHSERAGPFTGEISAGMLREANCSHVIVGHSERRTLYGESDGDVNRKARAVLDADLLPIVCIGETLGEREAGQTDDVLRRQIEGSLNGIGEQMREAVVAYEPVWAIGTGRTATSEQVQAAHAHIRGTIETMTDSGVAADVRILYGGSVKPSNAAEIFACPDVDGGLIGGASLEAGAFVRIVEAA